jgi:hypothetical protein
MGDASLEIAKLDVPMEEKKRLLEGRATQMMAEFEAAGIKFETIPLYKDWPAPPPS